MKPIKHKLPATHEEWLQQRSLGIGGSDAGAVLGVNKWKTPLKLWLEKTGQIDGSVPENEALWFGKVAEDLVARRFMEETGKRIKKSGYMFQHPDYPWMLANVDRLIVGERAGLECKTANFFADDGYTEGYVPDSYYAQCYHYMAVTGLDRWYLAVMIAGKSFHVFCIERDEEQIEALIEAEKEFWECVQNGQQPEAIADDGKLLSTMYPLSDEEAGADLEGMESDFERLATVKEMQSSLKKERDDIESRIKQRMTSAETGSISGWKATWKTYEKPKFDEESFAEENPVFYEKYLKASTYRMFRVRKVKEKR